MSESTHGNCPESSRNDRDIMPKVVCKYEQMHQNGQPSDDDKKEKRRVRFPDGEVISDYLEPFRPVPDNCTSEELIAAYLESCFQYKVAPIEFLLEQLKGIDLSICNERYSRLSLKGVRLNRLQVETLEEIFRRVHFRELDFEGTYLDDQSAVAFFDMLLHYETCNELIVTLNLDKIQQSQAWARCVALLRRSSELRRFALTHTPLTVSNFLTLSFYGLCVERLSLRDCNLSGQALFGLVRWLRLLLSSPSLDPPGRDKSGVTRSTRRSRYAKCTPFCRKQPAIWELKLDLASNKLNVTDAETLLMLIRHYLLVPYAEQPSSCSTESSQDAVEQSDSDDREEVAARLLPVGGIGFLVDLDLSNNYLGDDGLRVICTGLLQCYRNRLRQIHADQSTVTGQDALKEESFQTSSSVSSTNPEDVSLRVRGLERLCLANNGLTSTGMQIVALMLMQTPLRLVSLVGGLISLDLSNNPGIRDEGVEILCEGLIRNHSLKELYLRAVKMSFSGVFALSGFLSESKNLRMLDIRSNQLDLASLMALSKTLALNYTLTGFLSDARSMANSNNPLFATDAELITFLLGEIDSCLRRNRALLEGKADSATYPYTVTSVLKPKRVTSCDNVDSSLQTELPKPNLDTQTSEGAIRSQSDLDPLAEASNRSLQQPLEDPSKVSTPEKALGADDIVVVNPELSVPSPDYFTEFEKEDNRISEDPWTFVNTPVDDHPGAPTQIKKALPSYGAEGRPDLQRDEEPTIFIEQSLDGTLEPPGDHSNSSHLYCNVLPTSKQDGTVSHNRRAFKRLDKNSMFEVSVISSSPPDDSAHNSILNTTDANVS